MEKYINETSKWYDENQTNPNAQELFTTKIKETEDFFAPFYANATGTWKAPDVFLFQKYSFSFLAEADLLHPNNIRPQAVTPKSGRK